MNDSVENQLAFRRQRKRIILNSAAAIIVIPAIVAIFILSAASGKPTGSHSNLEAHFKFSLAAASRSLSNVVFFLDTLPIPTAEKRLQTAIRNCKNLLGDAIYQLKDSPRESYSTYSKMSKIMSWLSASIANQRECLEGFEGTRSGLRQKAEAAIVNSTEHTSHSLAAAAAIMGTLKEKSSDGGRFSDRATTMDSIEFVWLPNVTVAKDGSGQVESIQEALNLVPDESAKPFVIYVKQGIYQEYVVVEITKWNVYMMGDGMYSTIVTGNKNSVDFPAGIATRDTATFSVSGHGFVAKDIGFQNTAGPAKHQAVALFSNADESIFYRCSFDGYQDTLFAHSNRQFYRECEIIGTVDFIFGDAAAVFQGCNILPREPLRYQQNVITAQGKDRPLENTGFSIHGCSIEPYDTVTRPTYLSRPWKSYSTTVIMKTEISSIIDRAGWKSWDGTVPPGTIKFAEFENTGPGADTSGRVHWPGCWPAISEAEAIKYTVPVFINGVEWIPPSGVPFSPYL